MKHTFNRSLGLTGFIVIGILSLAPAIANAASDSFAASLGVGSGCVGSVQISGYSSSTVSVVSGSQVNVTVENVNPVTAQNVTGPGINTQLAASSRDSTGTYEQTFQLGTVTSQQVLTFTPVPGPNPDPVVYLNDCPVGSTPVSSSMIINVTAPPPVSTPAISTPAYTGSATTTSPSSTPTSTPPATTLPAQHVTKTPLHVSVPPNMPVTALKAKSDSSVGTISLVVIAIILVALIIASYFGRLPYRHLNKFNRLKKTKKTPSKKKS